MRRSWLGEGVVVRQKNIRFEILSTPNHSTFVTDYKHPHIVSRYSTSYLTEFYIYKIFQNFSYFHAHPVNNICSHITQYALTVPLAYERSPEDGLKKDRNMLPQ